MKIEVSSEVARPVSTVFRFFAREHVRNHPRWDPDIELEQVSDGPIGVGTVIKRLNKRSGTPVEGTMEVVEFEPDRAFATIIREGPVTVQGRTTFEPLGPDRARLTIVTDMPADPRWDPALITARMQRSADNIAHLIETET